MKRIRNEIFWMLGALLVFSWCIGFLHGQQDEKKKEKSMADVPAGKVEKKIRRTSYSALDPLLISRSIDKVIEMLSSQSGDRVLGIVSDIIHDKILYRKDELQLIGALAKHFEQDKKIQERFFELLAKTPRLYQFTQHEEPFANVIARFGFASILPIIHSWVQNQPELHSHLKNFITDALDYAATHDDVAVLQAMVQGGIQISPQRATELLFKLASAKNKGMSIEFLKNQGANLNALDAKKWTPLLYAVYNNNIPLVESLLKQGSDINLMPTAQVGTALQLSITRSFIDMEKVLRENGAKD